jgi:hypothetical protein
VPATGAGVEARRVEVTLTEFAVASSLTTFQTGVPYAFAQPALPSAGDAGPAASAAIASPDLVDRLLTDVQPVWREPTWPPGTRRAYFQVYRI